VPDEIAAVLVLGAVFTLPTRIMILVVIMPARAARISASGTVGLARRTTVKVITVMMIRATTTITTIKARARTKRRRRMRYRSLSVELRTFLEICSRMSSQMPL
jgi:hypothetical protein